MSSLSVDAAGGSQEYEESFARRLALAPLTPFALAYALAARVHRAAYAHGLLPQRHPGCRVVSVGNLAVGGSAKTPSAAFIASALRRRGHRVALASRGYGRRSRAPVVVVSDGHFVHASVREAGDEPMLLAGLAPDVPVVVARDRGLAALHAAGALGCDVVVLDDGFQHHRLGRQVDVVLIDAGLGLGNRWTLPRGPLRESVAALRHADAIGVVDGTLSEHDESTLARVAPHALRFAARRRPAALRPLGGGEALAPRWLAGRGVGLLAGIARPQGLRAHVERLGARVVCERFFADHHRWRPRDVVDLARATPLWVTTEKDALKIPRSWVGRANVLALAIELELEGPETFLDWMETRLR